MPSKRRAGHPLWDTKVGEGWLRKNLFMFCIRARLQSGHIGPNKNRALAPEGRAQPRLECASLDFRQNNEVMEELRHKETVAGNPFRLILNRRLWGARMKVLELVGTRVWIRCDKFRRISGVISSVLKPVSRDDLQSSIAESLFDILPFGGGRSIARGRALQSRSHVKTACSALTLRE